MLAAVLATACALLLTACQATPTLAGFSAAQRAVLAANGFVERGDGWELTMAYRVLFGIDESSLKADQLTRVARVGSELVRVGITSARVEGHTDSTGTHNHNAKLSMARAQTVAAPLRAAGMNFSQGQIVGRGEAFPVGDNRTEEGRADNRRVVLIVTP